jgi:hypothetical protein
LRQISTFDVILVSDYTDHRPPHRLKSNLALQLFGRIMPASRRRINMLRPLPTLRSNARTSARRLDRALRSSQAYFASPLIEPLARRGAERALAAALGRAQR